LLLYFDLKLKNWGLGIGDWGLGIGPNPQSPIPKLLMIIIFFCAINIINNY